MFNIHSIDADSTFEAVIEINGLKETFEIDTGCGPTIINETAWNKRNKSHDGNITRSRKILTSYSGQPVEDLVITRRT